MSVGDGQDGYENPRPTEFHPRPVQPVAGRYTDYGMLVLDSSAFFGT